MIKTYNFDFVPTAGVSGLGDKVLKIIDKQTREELGWVGQMNGSEVLFFHKPITVSRLTHLLQFIRTDSQGF